MNELRLYSQIPAPRYEQVVNILAGLAASQPTAITESCLIYQQLKKLEATVSKKAGSKQLVPSNQKLSYHKLVRDVSSEAAGPWRIRIEDVPDPASKTAISQSVDEQPAIEAHLQLYRRGSEWYRFVKEYVHHGVRFVHGNIIFKLTRVFVASEHDERDPIDRPPPDMSNMRVLDASGTWFLELCVRTENGSSPVVHEMASKELEAISKELDGSIDLRVPDRLALDTKVKA